MAKITEIDREKAIKALECCLRGNCNKHKDCAYSFADDCMGKLLGDVLELLKEQEPKPPIHIHEEYSEHDWETDKDGNIDEWVMAYGYHNGPGCKRCGYSFCMHCNPDGWNEKPCVIDYYQCPNCRKRILNNGKNIEYCVNCGQEVKWE